MRHVFNFYLSLIFIVQIICGIDLSLSGTVGNPTCQGRRLRKWKIYVNNSQREKGKCPKYMTKDVITKAGKFWQRRPQFPFGDSEKLLEQKKESFD